MSFEVTSPEIGASGEFFMGRALWDRQDVNPELHSGKSFDIYESMRSKDGEIAGSLARLLYPIQSATVNIESPVGEDPDEHEPTLLCREVLLREQVSGRTEIQSWSDILRHILLMVPFGFSMLEKVWGVDDRGRQIYDHFVPLLPRTFYKFTFNGAGVLESATQRAWSLNGKFEDISIPAWKFAVFVFGREGRNMFGRSALRSAYGHWFHKKLLMEIDTIRHERSGVGVAWIEIPVELEINATKQAAFEKTVRELRVHERQGLYIPPGCKLHVDYPSGTGTDLLGSLRYHDQQMSRSLITEFMSTGNSETGSRAVVASKIDFMMLALQGITKIVEEAINQQLIVELVDRNFGPQEEYPRLQFEDMDKMSGEQKASIMKMLADAGLLVPDKPLRAHIRETNDLPEEDEATLELPMPPIMPGAQVNGNGGGSAIGNGGKPESPRNRVSAVTKAREARVFSRSPFEHERHSDFVKMADYLDTEPERIWHRIVKPLRDQQITRIAEHAAAASDGDLAQGKLIRPSEKRMASDLSAALMNCYMHGRKTIVEETAKQKLGKADDDGEEDDIVSTPAQGKWIERIAAGFAATAIMALISEAVRSGLNARQQDLPRARVETAIRGALTDLSEPRVVAQLGGKVAQSFTTGRNDQIEAMKDEFDTYFYSSMLDSNVCDVCFALDGAEHDFGDPTFQTPNPGCLGGLDMCRCETIAIVRQAVEAA